VRQACSLSSSSRLAIHTLWAGIDHTWRESDVAPDSCGRQRKPYMAVIYTTDHTRDRRAGPGRVGLRIGVDVSA